MPLDIYYFDRRSLNPLILGDEIIVSDITLSIDGHQLIINTKGTGQMTYTSWPYDSVIVFNNNGLITMRAIDWLVAHGTTVTMLNWRGDIIANILPEPPISNKLRIAQYKSYLNEKQRKYIAGVIVSTKIIRSRELLQSLSQYFDINIPDTAMTEGNYAKAYFTEFAKITKQFGFHFVGRNAERTMKHNMNAGDIVNSAMNFSYAVMQEYVTRSINALGLDDSIPYVHRMRDNKTGLVFDLQELWRSNCDYAVLLTLEEIKKQHLHWKIDHYEVRLGNDIIAVLIEKLKLVLSMQEILHNTRILASYITDKTNKLKFELLPIKVVRQDTAFTRHQIMNRTAKQLNMNKSTHWYMKQRLLNNGSLRLYTKTKKQLS